MKKILIPLALLVILAVTVIPAAAGGNGPQGPGRGQGTPQATPQGTRVMSQQRSPRGTFAITGTIAAVDSLNGTVTISVVRGNKLVQAFLGTDVTVTTTARTRFLFKADANSTATAITMAELLVGNPVSVNGTVANGTWTATRITVGASLSCLP